MRRGGCLRLIVVLVDGSRLMLPAAWTDFEEDPRQCANSDEGQLFNIASLLKTRIVIDQLLRRRDSAKEVNPRADTITTGRQKSGQTELDRIQPQTTNRSNSSDSEDDVQDSRRHRGKGNLRKLSPTRSTGA